MVFQKVNENTYVESELSKEIFGIKDYDEIDNTSPENLIIGKMHKKFVRMDSIYFNRFFQERAKGERLFASHLLDEDDELGFVPNKLSALIKKASLSRDCVYETYVPEVMRNFNALTVYNTSCQDLDGFSYIASIDFIKPNERFILYSEIKKHLSDFGSDLNLEDSVQYVSETVKTLYERENISLTKSGLNEHLKSFVRSYLVRVCLLLDYDFTSRNCGFLINDKTKTIRNAPDFDYELCFRLNNAEFLSEDIEYAYNNYPEILEEFICNLEEFTKKENGIEKYKSIFACVRENKTIFDKYRDGIFDIINGQNNKIKSEYMKVKGLEFGK